MCYPWGVRASVSTRSMPGSCLIIPCPASTVSIFRKRRCSISSSPRRSECRRPSLICWRTSDARYNWLEQIYTLEATAIKIPIPIMQMACTNKKPNRNDATTFVAPKRVTNVCDDKVRSSSFWKGSFEERRCLVPVTSFSEPKGRSPATWHWFALKGDEPRPLFAFAGLWRSFRGPIQKDGEAVDIDVFAFLTTRPNDLVATVHPSRMPVILAFLAERTRS
jgi:SOS response associated peptidase (SRAP)